MPHFRDFLEIMKNIQVIKIVYIYKKVLHCYDKVHWRIQSKHKQQYNTLQIGTFEGFVIILDGQYWMSTYVIA